MVLAATTKKSATRAPEIQLLVPVITYLFALITYLSRFRTARVRIAWVSEPASGSERQKAPRSSPPART